MAIAWIDLNADLGEGFPHDEAILKIVSSASVSCGSHAGDDRSILSTLRTAKTLGVVVGAHPGFPDREGFGRRNRALSRTETRELVTDQVLHLCMLADSESVAIRFVKPHGALYNQAQIDAEIALGIVDSILDLKIRGLAALGLPDSDLERAASRVKVPFVAEGFADRGYDENARLIPRGSPGAMLTDQKMISDQVVQLARGGRVRTLCIHGDDPHAVENATRVRKALEAAGIAVRAFPP